VKTLHFPVEFQLPRWYLSHRLNGLRKVCHRLKAKFLIYMYFMFIYSQMAKWKSGFEFRILTLYQ